MRKTMNDCKHYEALIAGHLFGTLEPEEAERLEAHLASCPACHALMREMETTLRVTASPMRPEPPPAFWDGYYERLEARMQAPERRPDPVGHLVEWLRVPERLNWGALLLGPRWAYQLSGAAALLAVGVLIGWLLFGHAAAETPQVAHEETVETPTPVQAVSVEERADRYLERSRVLLMGLVNLDPEQDLSMINLTRQQQVASELIAESTTLKAELSDDEQEKMLRALIEDLEVILLQIANLEAEYDLPTIEMVQHGVDRRAILLKINVAEMRRADKPL